MSKRIISFLPKDRFIRSATILAGGTTLAQGLAILLSPVLTRLYTPGDFGILAVYTSVLTILLNLASFRYEQAIPIPDDDQQAINLVVLSLALVLVTSVLFSFGIVFFSDGLEPLHRFSVLRSYAWILPFGFFFAGSYQVFNCWAIRDRIYPTIARTSVSQGIAGVSTQLALGFLKYGPIGLLVGQIIGQSAGLGTLARHFWKKNIHNLPSVSVASLWTAARRYKDFPLYQSNASLLNSAGLQVPAVLFVAYYSAEVAGWFYLTQKVLAMPISLVGSSVSKVFLGEAARLLREPRKLQQLYRSINLKLIMIGVGPCLILALGGQWIFKFVFGQEWVQSGIYVQVMAFVFLLKLSTDSVINFAVIERQDLSFAWALLRLVLVVFGIMTAVWLGLSGFWAVVLFSGAMVISYITKYVMWGYAVRQLISQEAPVS